MTIETTDPTREAGARRKRERLVDRLDALAPVVVALSGGVDSSFLLAIAVETLGARAIAAVGVSPSLDGDDLEEARAFARRLGVELREVATHELDDPGYVANAGDRCFFCKTELYRRILAATEDLEGRTVVDGTHAGDLGDDRPGLRANAALGVESPLAEAGLTKPEIRYLARSMALPSWDKPEAACLASRVPVGTAVTGEILSRIQDAERALRALGLRAFRVRHEGRIARIETGPDDMRAVLEARDAVVAALVGVGYDHATLDLAGYRRGGRPPERGDDR